MPHQGRGATEYQVPGVVIDAVEWTKNGRWMRPRYRLVSCVRPIEFRSRREKKNVKNVREREGGGVDGEGVS